VLATGFLGCAAATYYLWREYASMRPSVLDEASGQVHALYALGWTVYLSRADQLRFYGLGAAAAACLVGAVALDTFVLSGKNSE
jgi:hypothetical protein